MQAGASPCGGGAAPGLRKTGKPPFLAAFVIPSGSSGLRVEEVPEGWIGHCFRATEELDEGSALAFGGTERHGKEPGADLTREAILGKLDGE